MIRIQISKSTGDITHIDERGQKVTIKGRGKGITLAYIKSELKIKGLKLKESRRGNN